MNGWPQRKQDLDNRVKPYFDFADTLGLNNGVILKGEGVVIPFSMRQEMKKKLHTAHIAYDGMMRRARQTMFWPGMADEIKQMAETCTACQERKPMNQRETLIQHDEGNVPWEKVGADLMEVDERQYLITVDYYSNFIEHDYLSTTTSQDVIRKLKGQFARFGAPKMLITDGGPQFSSNEFLRFTRRWNIHHIRSDPGYPRTNGKAEAAVKIMKNLILKTKHNGDDPYEALLELRNTPRQCTGFSPVEMCLKRSPRTLIPSTSKCLRWYPGIIREQPSPRFYKINGDNGGFYIRNRFHIRPRKTIVKDTDVYDGNVLDDDDDNERPDFSDNCSQHAAQSGVVSHVPDNNCDRNKPARTSTR
ncbi:uncharacterized protein K02A2.6-like [Biomphalaria glabrata]|uniref:Uncharacterized protein K02A2.6-like n=1 Tax=Biomphalaria glabrata TaxID=6526 RepID=A0A9W2YIZ0_BIOGL|nr:uncharacterized protein K02A2.6-like [Biomphalaria glabrata]